MGEYINIKGMLVMGITRINSNGVKELTIFSHNRRRISRYGGILMEGELRRP